MPQDSGMPRHVHNRAIDEALSSTGTVLAVDVLVCSCAADAAHSFSSVEWSPSWCNGAPEDAHAYTDASQDGAPGQRCNNPCRSLLSKARSVFTLVKPEARRVRMHPFWLVNIHKGPMQTIVSTTKRIPAHKKWSTLRTDVERPQGHPHMSPKHTLHCDNGDQWVRAQEKQGEPHL